MEIDNQLIIIYLGRQLGNEGDFVFKLFDLRESKQKPKEYFINLSEDLKHIKIMEKL